MTGGAHGQRRAATKRRNHGRCAPRPFPASARGRRRVSETSEGEGPKTQPPQLPSWDGRRPRAGARDQAAYFHSPSENSREASESKGLGPENPRRTLKASTCRTGSDNFPQATRLFARRRPMGRGRSHIAPFPAEPQPAGPTVIGHLAPVKNMDSHREWIQAPVLASLAAVADCRELHARNG